jgi:RsmE family RNA methyltransferase
LGLKTIYLINSSASGKKLLANAVSYRAGIENELFLGLEQSRDTILPKLLRKLFKPFVEDELGDIIVNTKGLVGHPSGTDNCPIDIQTANHLVVGPEGGFIPYEIEKLQEVGVEAVTIGPRILRVETAIPALISRLFPS